MQTDALETALLDLVFEFERSGIQLILGGGYGLYLKQIELQQQDSRTLIDVSLWPEARSTGDMDTFVPTELVANNEQWASIRKALDRLGYTPVDNAKFMRFRVVTPAGYEVGFDLLTGPLGSEIDRTTLNISGERVRPRATKGLHARLAKDAIGLDDYRPEMTVRGHRSDGSQYAATVSLPHPFTYLITKLHAFFDRRNDGIFRIVAMMTEADYSTVQAQIRRFVDDPMLQGARRIVKDHFSSRDALGLIRIREYDPRLVAKWEQDVSSSGADALDEFMGALQDLFGTA